MVNQRKLRTLWKRFQKGKYAKILKGCCFGIVIIGCLWIGSYYYASNQSEKEIDGLRAIKAAGQSSLDEDTITLLDEIGVLPQYQDLYIQNPDLMGWLTISGTNVDYPVMWTPEDVEYYSHRGFDKQDSNNGLLFMDESSGLYVSGGNVIIYGHNMKNGSMFADLLKYKDESYLEKHPIIQLDTLYEERFYQIIGVMVSNEAEKLPYNFVVSNETAATIALKNFQENALYCSEDFGSYGEDFITLSTCDYSLDDGRLVVMGKRIQQQESDFSNDN